MRYLLLILILIVSVSCGKKESDLIVRGNVKGLKKGTIYLQKVSDTLLLAVDSVSIKGDSNFELHSTLDTPEMYYLYLDKNDNSESRLQFFADKGVTEINTTLKNFVYDAEINGSKQQDVLSEYNKMTKQFSNKQLDLFKAKFEAIQQQKVEIADSIQKLIENYDKRQFQYALNFSMNNLDSEVTPFIVLSDMYNANLKVLDTIYNNLDDKVLNSKYGIQLKEFIEKVKKTEQSNSNSSNNQG